MSPLGILCGKVYLTCSSSGRCGKCLSYALTVLKSLGIKGGMQKLVERFCLDPEYSLFLIDLALINKVACDLKGSLCRSLAVSCLKEVKITLFNGKLHILHIAVMILKLIGNLHEFCIALGKILFKLCDRLGSTDTGNNVLALCIDQILTEYTLLT